MCLPLRSILMVVSGLFSAHSEHFAEKTLRQHVYGFPSRVRYQYVAVATRSALFARKPIVG